VREFRHLESSLAGDNNITIEMKQGILMTNWASDGLKKQFMILTVIDKTCSML
jgi:hypothetical protein